MKDHSSDGQARSTEEGYDTDGIAHEREELLKASPLLVIDYLRFS